MRTSKVILAAGLLLAIFLSACSTRPKNEASEGNALRNPYWMLLSIGGQSPQAPNDTHTAYIRFDENQNDVNGFTGCNRFFGKYEANEESKTLKLSNLGSTKMMCPSIDLENQFMRLLGEVDAYSISEDVLTLYASGEAVATFKAGAKPSLDDDVKE